MPTPGRDLIGGVAASLIGVTYLLLASQIRSSALDDALGPGGMPKAYGWAMLVLGIVLVCIALLRLWHPVSMTRSNKESTLTSSADIEQQFSDADAPNISRQIIRAGGLLLFGIAYVLLLEQLGYLLSIALLIVAVALYMGERASARVLLIGAFGAIAMWVMFVHVLGVAMPAGVFNFL